MISKQLTFIQENSRETCIQVITLSGKNQQSFNYGNEASYFLVPKQ